MRIVALSDTHCRHKSVKLPKGDLLIHAGDISYRGKLSEVTDFLSWFGALPHPHKIFIAGNHDFYFEKASSLQIQELLPPGVLYLNDCGVTINNINVWGSPVTPWFYNWAFNRPRGAAIDLHWNLIPDDTQILITHGPAFGILDTVINGNHVGDKGLLKRIETVKPALHICGHIHEAHGRVKRGATRFINASILNEKYECVNPPVVVDL